MSFLPQWLLDVQNNCKQTSSLHDNLVEDISALRDHLTTFDDLIASVRGKNDAEGSLRALTHQMESSSTLSHALIAYEHSRRRLSPRVYHVSPLEESLTPLRMPSHRIYSRT